jgi:hypothetical protein
MEAAECFKIMAFAPFHIRLNNVMGTQAMLVLKNGQISFDNHHHRGRY